jgi:hypothetical protein
MDRRWLLGAELADATYKISAQALANHGLVDVRRKRNTWTANITDAGRFYLKHGRFEPRPFFEPEELLPDEGSRLARGQHRSDHPAPDATARAIRLSPLGPTHLSSAKTCCHRPSRADFGG